MVNEMIDDEFRIFGSMRTRDDTHGTITIGNREDENLAPRLGFVITALPCLPRRARLLLFPSPFSRRPCPDARTHAHASPLPLKSPTPRENDKCHPEYEGEWR